MRVFCYAVKQRIFPGRIRALDADEGRNAVLLYRIVPDSLPRAEFIIDAVRGDLMVGRTLAPEYPLDAD